VAQLSGRDLGQRFAAAIAAKDSAAISSLLAPDVDFRALTPRKFWEAATPAEVLDVLFANWFGETDHIDELVEVTSGPPVEDTDHVGYRLAVTNPDGPHTVEQQAYYRAEDDQISYLRIVCSGYRPVEG
jgi:hypothetical protein